MGSPLHLAALSLSARVITPWPAILLALSAAFFLLNMRLYMNRRPSISTKLLLFDFARSASSLRTLR